VQSDGSWKVAADHTLRAGFLLQRERATSQANGQVLPVDAAGGTTSDVPLALLFGSDDVGWLGGVYLQDEWKVTHSIGLTTTSALVGAIWQVRENIAFDVGLRAAQVNDQPLREVRFGVTFGFPVR